MFFVRYANAKAWRDNLKIRLAFRLMFLLVTMIAAVDADANNAAVKELTSQMSQSAANLSAFSLKMSDTQTDSIKNLERNNITIRIVQNEASSSIDLAGQKAMTDMSTTTTIKGPTGLPNITKSGGTKYDIGNMTYLITDDGNWTQYKDPISVDVLWAEGRYNLIKSRADAINQSDVEVIGSESIDGKDCYKLRIIADSQSYYENIDLSLRLMSVLFPLMYEVNQTELIKAIKIENLVWIEKDSNLLKKYQHTFSMTFSPNIEGVFDSGNGSIRKFNQSIKLIEVSLNTNYMETYFDYNKPAAISLPVEANPLANEPL
jgi:hypothetical protein